MIYFLLFLAIMVLFIAIAISGHLYNIRQIQEQRLACELQMQNYYFMLNYDYLVEALKEDWTALEVEMALLSSTLGAPSPA